MSVLMNHPVKYHVYCIEYAIELIGTHFDRTSGDNHSLALPVRNGLLRECQFSFDDNIIYYIILLLPRRICLERTSSACNAKTICAPSAGKTDRVIIYSRRFIIIYVYIMHLIVNELKKKIIIYH